MNATDELKSLVYDNTSGAHEIAGRALQLLQAQATQSQAATAEGLVDELADTAVQILRSKPEMAPVLGVLNAVLLETEADGVPSELGALRLHLVSLLQDHQRTLARRHERVAAHAASLIQNGEVLFTHSRSSTVLHALKAARTAGKTFDVVLTESRPNLEGRTLAEELAREQIPVRLVVDALAPTAVEGADRVLLGADALTPEHVVNKAGTRLVARAARDHDRPIHVLADSTKAWRRAQAPPLGLLTGKPRDPREVWDGAPFGVEIVNLYFDLTPLAWVTSLATETGLQTPDDFWTGLRATGVSARLRRRMPNELS